MIRCVPPSRDFVKICVVAFRLKGITSAPRLPTSAWRSGSAAHATDGKAKSAVTVTYKRCFFIERAISNADAFSRRECEALTSLRRSRSEPLM